MTILKIDEKDVKFSVRLETLWERAKVENPKNPELNAGAWRPLEPLLGLGQHQRPPVAPEF